MGDKWDKFKGMFVEVDDKPKPKKVVPVQETPVYTPVITGNPVGEFIEYFKQIMKEENERNFPGNDYYEFCVIKSNFSGIPEPQAYTAAFNGLSAAGLTKHKLLETANVYITIVDREIEEFNSSFTQMYTENVTKKEQEILSKQEELTKVSQRMAQLNGEISALRTEVMVNTQKLTDKKNGFILAGNSQKQEIENEIIKINQYIS